MRAAFEVGQRVWFTPVPGVGLPGIVKAATHFRYHVLVTYGNEQHVEKIWKCEARNLLLAAV